ncbi:hypothetical protein [Lysobacter capsici]|uniref:hypothetical protein n=1 Tax=Lysobacter capsici TaxID=435897 RepID=UPI00287BA9C8|nr:hypothetical protein [Lysobacter capsici]WND82993.1 hypothetical protein RJ610_11875 [Lysobacter capsici]WND88192.1 hypothetical protein RJ609_11885 [Lysobacter capsici]
MRLLRIKTTLLLIFVTGCSVPSHADKPATAESRPQKSQAQHSSKAQEAPTVQPMDADACGNNDQDFDNFFNAYIYRPELRPQHTSPSIEIRQISDKNKKIGTETKEQNKPFKIGLIDYRWSYVTAHGKEEKSDRIEIKIHREGNAMQVDFIRAKYTNDDTLIRTYGPEGAYVFEHKNNCWQLTQELR